MFLIPISNDSHWVTKMKEDLGSLLWFKVYFIKAQVQSSIGETFIVRIDRNIRDLLKGKVTDRLKVVQ